MIKKSLFAIASFFVTTNSFATTVNIINLTACVCQQTYISNKLGSCKKQGAGSTIQLYQENNLKTPLLSGKTGHIDILNHGGSPTIEASINGDIIFLSNVQPIGTYAVISTRYKDASLQGPPRIVKKSDVFC